METFEDWACVLAASLCMFGFAGYNFIHGIFYLQYLEVFNRGPFLTSWTEAAASLSFVICGPIAGLLCNRLSPKILMVTAGLMFSTFFVCLAFAPTMEIVLAWYAVLGGPSRGLGIVTAIVYINRRFSKKRQRANGVLMLSMSFCGILYPFFLHTVLESYSLRGCLLIHAGVVLHICVLALLLRERPVRKENTLNRMGTQNLDLNETEKVSECYELPPLVSISNNKKAIHTSVDIMHETEKEKGEDRFATFKALCNRKYMTFLVWFCAGKCALLATLQFLPAYGCEIGMSDAGYTSLPAIYSAFETAGRLFLIAFGEAKWFRKEILIILSWIVLSIVAFVVPLIGTPWILYFFSALSGLFNDTMTVFIGPLIVESVGLKSLGPATGNVPVMFGIARLSIPPICGFVRAKTGTYGNAMIIGGIAWIVGTAAFAIFGKRLSFPRRLE